MWILILELICTQWRIYIVKFWTTKNQFLHFLANYGQILGWPHAPPPSTPPRVGALISEILDPSPVQRHYLYCTVCEFCCSMIILWIDSVAFHSPQLITWFDWLIFHVYHETDFDDTSNDTPNEHFGCFITRWSIR